MTESIRCQCAIMHRHRDALYMYIIYNLMLYDVCVEIQFNWGAVLGQDL